MGKCSLPKAGAQYSKHNPDWVRIIGEDECEAFADDETLVLGHFLSEALAERLIHYFEWTLAVWKDHDTSIKEEARALLDELTK